MSTRANIKVTDGSGDQLWFYKHSDGYPDGTMPLLETFLERVKKGQYRDNVGQASGHLIILGRLDLEESWDKFNEGKWPTHYEWKVGTIEPTTEQHGDIEWLYTIDLKKKEIIVEEV